MLLSCLKRTWMSCPVVVFTTLVVSGISQAFPAMESPFDPRQYWGVSSYERHSVWTTTGYKLGLDFLYVMPENAKEPSSWIATPKEGSGKSVRAAHAGTIVHAGELPRYGKTVVIQSSSDRQYYTLYAHLDSVRATLKSRVEQGEEIGTVGKDGEGANGLVHLHFEMLKDSGSGANWKLATPQDLTGLQFGYYKVDFAAAKMPVLGGQLGWLEKPDAQRFYNDPMTSLSYCLPRGATVSTTPKSDGKGTLHVGVAGLGMHDFVVKCSKPEGQINWRGGFDNIKPIIEFVDENKGVVKGDKVIVRCYDTADGRPLNPATAREESSDKPPQFAGLRRCDYAWDTEPWQQGQIAQAGIIELTLAKPGKHLLRIRAEDNTYDAAGNPKGNVSERTVTSVSPQKAAPPVAAKLKPSVVFVIDRSGSITSAQGVMQQLQEDANKFAAAICQYAARAAVINFSGPSECALDADFTGDVNSLRNAIEHPSVGRGSTALYDAIINAVARAQDSGEAPMLIVLSDGHNNTSRADLERAIATAKGAAKQPIPIIVVGYEGTEGKNEPDLRALADSTHGFYRDNEKLDVQSLLAAAVEYNTDRDASKIDGIPD